MSPTMLPSTSTTALDVMTAGTSLPSVLALKPPDTAVKLPNSSSIVPAVRVMIKCPVRGKFKNSWRRRQLTLQNFSLLLTYLLRNHFGLQR